MYAIELGKSNTDTELANITKQIIILQKTKSDLPISRFLIFILIGITNNFLPRRQCEVSKSVAICSERKKKIIQLIE